MGRRMTARVAGVVIVGAWVCLLRAEPPAPSANGDEGVARYTRLLLDKNENVLVRRRAAVALGRMGAQARTALPALEQALTDADPKVREAAAAALEQIDPVGSSPRAVAPGTTPAATAVKPEDISVEAVSPAPPDRQVQQRLQDLNREVKKELDDELRPGQGGSGAGGGKGTGQGMGEGVGHATMSNREKRRLRWTLVFNTANGEEYARQLQALGAFVAYPDPKGGYWLIRDWKKGPVKVDEQELNNLRLIFWVDNQKDSVAGLARALKLDFVPPHIVAFFPPELEKELLSKEVAYHNAREEDIVETRFRVVRQGNTFVPVVIDQRVKPGTEAKPEKKP